MNRFGAGLRKAAAGAAIAVAAGALVAFPATQAGASTAKLVVEYDCTQGIAHSNTVRLYTELTVPTTLTVGQPLAVSAVLWYKQNSPKFRSPDYFGPGATVTATANVQLSGGWQGILQPTGPLEQENALIPGTELTLPTQLADAAATDRAAEVRITPTNMVVDFTPPEGSVVINDDDPRVTYDGTWYDLNGRDPRHKDHYQDIHETWEKDARAVVRFTGTGIDYITEKDDRAGPLVVRVDDQVYTPPFVDPSKDENGVTVNLREDGGHTVWSVDNLKYGKHTLVIRNREADKRTVIDAFRVHISHDTNSGEPELPFDAYRATCTPVGVPNTVIVNIGGNGNGNGNPSGSPSSTPGEDPGNDPNETPGGNSPGNPSAGATPTPTPTPTTGNANTNGLTYNVGGQLVICDPVPNSSPAASPSRSPSPTPSASASASPSGSPSSSPSASLTPAASLTPTPTPSASAPAPVTSCTPVANASASPRPTRTVFATVTASPQVRFTPVGGAQTGDAPEQRGALPLTVAAAGFVLLSGSVAGGFLLRRRLREDRG